MYNIVAGLKYALLFAAMFTITSCVTTKEELLYLNDQIVALNSRVNKMEHQIDQKLSTDLEEKTESIRVRQAELRAEIQQIKSTIQDLSGRVEENNYLIKRVVERDTTEQDMMKAELERLTKEVAELDIKMKELYAYLGIKAKPETKPVPGGPPGQVTPAPATSLEDILYNKAMASFKEGKYEAAIAGFSDFLKKFPRSELADNAQFWIGEAYMNLGQYEKAILAFHKVVKKYPKGNKVPNAMLRQAVAFEQLKDKVSARLLLKRILKKYPKSPEAKIAKTKLKALK